MPASTDHVIEQLGRLAADQNGVYPTTPLTPGQPGGYLRCRAYTASLNGATPCCEYEM